jgi:predicted transcriptional regulator of viral defense system
MRPLVRTVEQEIARIAARQHGLTTRVQLLEIGVSATAIRRRLRKGTLIQVHRGVYRVGHAAPSTETSYLAAVYACGDGALLGGLSAAHLLGLIKGSPPPPEVICPTQRSIREVKTRRSRTIDPRDATTYRSIPVTSVPRTLVDLAAVLSPDDLARA